MTTRLHQVASGTIANGATTSSAIDIEGYINASLLLDTGWGTQTITFTGSHDGVTYFTIFDKTGTAVSITGAAANNSYELAAAVMNHKWIKVISGGAQAGGDTILVIMKT